LAQVDSSIGGKTAVNLPQGKNLAGVFYQPRLVVIDPRVLVTLPERDYRTGLAEALKYGVIRDAGLFRLMEKNVLRLRRRDLGLVQDLIERCVRIKLQVVGADEREGGLRMILNYGHTIGHAIEIAARFRLTHGEAISIGMNLEGTLAARAGLWKQRDLARQNALLEALGLPLRGRFPRQAVRSAMALDKKNKLGRIRFVLPTRIGRVTFPVEPPAAELEKVLGAGARPA
jgi:3-dehydroquinate synthase